MQCVIILDFKERSSGIQSVVDFCTHLMTAEVFH